MSLMHCLFAVALLSSLPARAEPIRDIRSPLSAGFVLTKDLSNEQRLPSTELTRVLDAAVQNKEFMFKIIVTKGSVMGAEVERQLTVRKLQNRVQLIEK